MFSLRRAAVRALSSQPSKSLSTTSTIRTLAHLRISSTPTLAAAQRSAFLPLQRRFASTNNGEEEDEYLAANAESNDITNEGGKAPSSGGVISETANAVAEAAAAAAGLSGGAEQAPSREVPEASSRRGVFARDAPPARSVYVGNLFFDVRDEDLKREFEAAGQVTDVRVIMDSRGLSKGFGYVEFATIEEATKAISLFNMTNYEGRRLSVQYSLDRAARRPVFDRGDPSTQQPMNAPTKTLFIGNMSFEMSDRDLNNLFRDVKNVIDVRVAIDRRTGQPRGFAHADFTDVKSAEAAMEELKGKLVSGRHLRVDFSTSSGRAARPSEGGRDARAGEGDL